MTRKFRPRLLRNVLAVSIAGIGAAAQPHAWAQDGDDEVQRLITADSEVELGIGYVSEDSFKFGNYTGLEDQGVHAIGNVKLIQRDKETARYLELSGRNLGLESRSLEVESGQQGNYGLRLNYDEIPRLWSDSYQTPFVNPGETVLTLPAGFVRGATTATMPTLLDSMRPFDIASKRKSLGIGLSKKLRAGWDMDVSVRRERRDGNRLIGAVIGNSGGNPRAAIVPEPTDFVTDELEAVARYTTKKLQLQFGYYGSFFNNKNNSLAWQNPFANSVWNPAATPNLVSYNTGQLALPPDNRFHQLSASAGYTVTPDTRISGNFSYGRGTQDEAFLPYTINPTLAATITTPLPRSSLDGKINTINADLKLSTRLMPKLNMLASYRYDERDNDTPQAQYWYVGGDSQSQPAAGISHIRSNLPHSTKKQQVDAELDYHYTPDTRVKVGYGFEWTDKTFEDITEEREHTVKADVQQHFNEMLSGGLGYAWSRRKVSGFDPTRAFRAAFTDAFEAAEFDPTLPFNGLWENVPTQLRFFMAPRQRDKLRAFLNAAPHERVDLQFSVDFKYDDYPDSQYGLQSAKGWAANFDATVLATDALTGNLFASYDRYSTEQRSIAIGGPALTNVTNPAFDWSASSRDKTVTLGAGLRYRPTAKYEVGTDLAIARSETSIGVVTGPSIPAAQQAAPLPDLTTRFGRLDLFGQYQMREDVAVRVKYIYERYRSFDWAYDQVLPNTVGNVIGTNQTTPHHNVHFLGVSVAYQF